jgi:hypothetical protein
MICPRFILSEAVDFPGPFLFSVGGRNEQKFSKNYFCGSGGVTMFL